MNECSVCSAVRCGTVRCGVVWHKPKVKVKTYVELSNTNRCILHAYGGVALRWHTRSQDHSIGEDYDYAKMKARPCKIVEDTLEDPRKNPWKMERHKPKVKVKTYMELSNTRQVHTSCIWRGVLH